jgi:hypothetical protein
VVYVGDGGVDAATQRRRLQKFAQTEQLRTLPDSGSTAEYVFTELTLDQVQSISKAQIEDKMQSIQNDIFWIKGGVFLKNRLWIKGGVFLKITAKYLILRYRHKYFI